MSHFDKDPDAVLDYRIDWSVWLASAAGDTLVTSDWEAEPGITIDDDDHDTTSATVWLSGGTVDTQYKVTNHVTTAGGRTDDRTLIIHVRER